MVAPRQLDDVLHVVYPSLIPWTDVARFAWNVAFAGASHAIKFQFCGAAPGTCMWVCLMSSNSALDPVPSAGSLSVTSGRVAIKLPRPSVPGPLSPSSRPSNVELMLRITGEGARAVRTDSSVVSYVCRCSWSKRFPCNANSIKPAVALLTVIMSLLM